MWPLKEQQYRVVVALNRLSMWKPKVGKGNESEHLLPWKAIFWKYYSILWPHYQASVGKVIVQVYFGWARHKHGKDLQGFCWGGSTVHSFSGEKCSWPGYRQQPRWHMKGRDINWPPRLGASALAASAYWSLPQQKETIGLPQPRTSQVERSANDPDQGRNPDTLLLVWFGFIFVRSLGVIQLLYYFHFKKGHLSRDGRKPAPPPTPNLPCNLGKQGYTEHPILQQLS